ncbi:hypothetical protein BDW59DRAFT_142352 [Aspergillus cavernicola]|uniref:Amino acid permease/ SLC12A domain-containing protein n=1 Tax=Aspergillus cavernicola TaxID=176166 RepID=A0ABR4INP0_9EURO
MDHFLHGVCYCLLCLLLLILSIGNFLEALQAVQLAYGFSTCPSTMRSILFRVTSSFRT